MSKIVKGFYVNEDEDDKLVIDSNSIADEKIELFLKKEAKEKEKRRKALISQYLNNLTTDEEGNAVFPKDEDGNISIPEDEDGNPLFSLDEEGRPILPDEEENEDGGFSEGIAAESDELSEEDYSHYAEDVQNEADRIISEAKEEAERIISEAKDEGEKIKSDMSDAGRREGYDEGISRAKDEFADKNKALEEERTSLEQDYSEKQKNIEKDTVDMVCDIVSKFFKIEFGDKKELLNNIVDNALLHIEDSRYFSIHVSREQFAGMNARRDELQKIVGESASVDVVADPLLKEGECLIETDSGVYDCSLDTEMDSLMRDLKALAIE